ncbi:MAG TPA: hypothetical protein VGQ76_04970 [Thermoanaerobaculia bacterium]|jgi:ELWxxDGT repeat protein|nr:hypothetical protein [Thermoanaerobaculia bacterium]
MRTFFAALAGVLCAMSAQAQAPYLVTDLNTTATPSTASSAPHSFAAIGPFVYFSATTMTTGAELFRTNGTTVQLVKDLTPGTSGSTPYGFVDLGNGTFVFSATSETYGRELWLSDGTAAGTSMVLDLRSGPDGSTNGPMVALGGKAFFLAEMPANRDLWVTDGTAAGTQQLLPSVTSTTQLRARFMRRCCPIASSTLSASAVSEAS